MTVSIGQSLLDFYPLIWFTIHIHYVFAVVSYLSKNNAVGELYDSDGEARKQQFNIEIGAFYNFLSSHVWKKQNQKRDQSGGGL